MKNNILIIRSSDFQFYCANKLFEKKLINMCVIEQGNSVKTQLSFNKKNLLRLIKDIKKFKNFFYRFIYLLFFYKLYGNNKFYNNRILSKSKVELNKNLKVKFYKDINDIECKQFVTHYDPKYLITFGTRIIDTDMYANKNFKTINMHWGISPKYRGEGIVSALSQNDFANLGVTIHELNHKIDDGKILCQKLITVNKLDNFYSLGLKMTVEGTKLIIDLLNGLPVKKIADNKIKGHLYDSNYYRENYIDFYLAYKNIINLKSCHEKTN